jgi:hypothetical protein
MSEKLKAKINEFKDKLGYSLAAIFYIGIFLFGAYWLSIEVFNWDECIETKKVTAVGGCGLFGTCGVKFEDDTFGQASHPVVGKNVCVDYSAYRISDDSLPMLKKKKPSPNILEICKKGNSFYCGLYGLSLKRKDLDVVAKPYLEIGCTEWLKSKNAKSILIRTCGALGRMAFENKNFKQAKEIYASMCAIDSNKGCLHLGSTEVALGDLNGKERIKKYHDAYGSQFRCLNSNDDSSCYNLACYHSINSDPDMSIYFLTKFLEYTSERDPWKEIDEDPDFNNLRSSDAYTHLKKIRREPSSTR